MAVSKRLRYEVLRRDNHACRYCGAAAPDVALTVDHVIPTSLGGKDEPANLVAACIDCNSGKAASNPGAPLVADVAGDALRWAAAMARAASIQQEQREQVDAALHEFSFAWGFYKYEGIHFDIPDDWDDSLYQFVGAGLTGPDLAHALDVAMRARHRIRPDRLWRYFCGICWRIVAERREIAGALVQADETEVTHESPGDDV
jgi:hypothetical protein